jgi:hypothetical protein
MRIFKVMKYCLIKRIVVTAMIGFGALPGIFAERINHEGRILGPLPVVTSPLLFNTTQADAVVAAMQIFPVTHAWNEDISRRPLLANSAAMISQIITDLDPTRRTFRAFYEMNFVLVPDNQARIPINFLNYPDESDLDGGTFPYGSYPIPSNMPIEGWPRATGTLTLSEWQRDNSGGDRHAIIVQPGTGFMWETWLTKLNAASAWEASNGAKWDLNSIALRPAGWAAGDAAALPMLGGLVRYDECQRGVVEHACRIVVRRTRAQAIYPATHFAATGTGPNTPAMGQRLRLRSAYVISNSWTTAEKAVLQALKKYGALVSDNGNFFSISVVPDNRWAPNEFTNLTSVSITNFEVIQTTGPAEGPRSPGAPVANAGPDQLVTLGTAANLNGFVSFASAPPPVIEWKLYSGPGAVAFGDASQTNTTADFSQPGIYTLMLSTSNGVHAVAYDAAVVTVADPIRLAIGRTGTNANVSWTGGGPPYVLQKATALSSNSWSPLLTTNSRAATVPMIGTNSFFRVQGAPF